MKTDVQIQRLLVENQEIKMKRQTLISRLLTAVLLIVAIALSGCTAETAEPDNSNTAAANTAPKQTIENSLGITLKDLKGNTVSLDDYAGKVVLVNFWATWCAPCIREMPDLVKLSENYKDQDVEVLGIVVSSPEQHVRRMAKDLKISYPVLFGDEETAMKFGGFTSIPKTFVINGRGEIVEDVTGMQSYEAFEKLVQRHI